MELNKMGIHIKKDMTNVLNKLFGKITKIEKVRHHNEATLGESVHLDNTAEKTLLEAEDKKIQAFELVRKLQNR
jgi:hypothetical protein